MTVGDLLDLLDGLDEDMPVFFAEQPAYPFEYDIEGGEVVTIEDEEILYLIEGEQIRYLPSEVVNAIGWAK